MEIGLSSSWAPGIQDIPREIKKQEKSATWTIKGSVAVDDTPYRRNGYRDWGRLRSKLRFMYPLRPMTMAERTLVNLMESSSERYPGNPLLWEKSAGAYRPTTYEECRRQVYRMAAGLMALGLEKGDRVSLISEGRNHWVISELAVLYCGAINVPLSVKLKGPSELEFRLSHSGSRILIASGTQLPKFSTITSKLKTLEKTIVLDPIDGPAPDVMTIEETMALGDEFLKSSRTQFEERISSVREEDPANICYTSGTTSDPKGVVLTHRNYTANVEQASAALPIPEEYCSLLILPWDHSFAHTCGIYTLMKNGASMAAVESGNSPLETIKNISINIQESKPTMLLSVPALSQNFRKNIEKGIRRKGKVVRLLFDLALKNAFLYNAEGFNRGRGIQSLRRPLHYLFDRILFSQVRTAFGGRLEFFIGGGALLDIEMQRFFYAIGIPIYQGYGLTEAAPVISANVPRRHKLGSSGSVVKGLLIRICDEEGRDLPIGQKGEILVKGENVMKCYWNNAEATKEVLRDGWLSTGDVGFLDEDGFLFVLGREKSLLISDDGEKYSPEGIEEAIVSHSELIDQVMLYNDQSKYTVALVVLNRFAMQSILMEQSPSEALLFEILERIQGVFERLKEGGNSSCEFPGKWLPSAFAVIPEGFSEENGFLNSTLKMVRNRIIEHYQERLEGLYTPEGRDLYSSNNLKILQGLFEHS